MIRFYITLLIHFVANLHNLQVLFALFITQNDKIVVLVKYNTNQFPRCFTYYTAQLSKEALARKFITINNNN